MKDKLIIRKLQLMFRKKTDITEYTNKVIPEKRQLGWQETDFVAHIFFGINTFLCGQESYGQTEPQFFYPTDIDIPSWVKTLRTAGVKGVLITAKHHDGFCLWRTKTTEYSVANSPYLDGQGDIVKELSDECRMAGMKFGFSFSLCDRNTTKKGEELEQLILDQLSELLTSYGEIYDVKLDRGGEMPDVNMDKIYSHIRAISPCTVISNGPDARHLGNTKMVCRQSEWNVVEPVCDMQKIIKIDGNKENTFRKADGAGTMELDLGSRKALKKANSLCWHPYFADVSMRDSWFYNKEEDLRTMFLQRLKELYFAVAGQGGVLQIGIPVDQCGRIHAEETVTLESFGIDMSMMTKNPVLKNSEITANCGGNSVQNLKNDDVTYFSSGKTDGKIEITVNFGEEKIVRLLEICENIETGQQIEAFSVYTLEGKKFKKAESHTTVGSRKLIVPKKAMVTSAVRFVIEETRGFANIRKLEIYCG